MTNNIITPEIKGILDHYQIPGGPKLLYIVHVENLPRLIDDLRRHFNNEDIDENIII